MNLSYSLLIPVQEDEKAYDITHKKGMNRYRLFLVKSIVLDVLYKKREYIIDALPSVIILGVCYLQFVKPYPSCCGHIFTAEFHKSQFGQFNTSAGIVPESLF